MKIKFKINKLIKIVIKLIFIAIFILLLTYNLGSIYTQEDYVKIMGYKIYIVKEYQENEEITKDTVLIVNTKKDKLEKNNIAVIKISAGTYFKKIDNVIGNERYIIEDKNNETTFLKEDIEGKVITQLPRFGKILKFIGSKTFSVITLFSVIIIFLQNNHQQKKKYRRRMKRNLEKNTET